ncbi:hypothetical protein GCM10010389_25660 [Streptomyces echinoruber]|uniref:Uncharacterized protein n=1 Tax=Streptomyces echinoruber TaxID=68898 RepID=A0A918R629_9ACTN|nr:hypothetical protein GCM10010389_25660 [Streptomyces echinoruber]
MGIGGFGGARVGIGESGCALVGVEWGRWGGGGEWGGWSEQRQGQGQGQGQARVSGPGLRPAVQSRSTSVSSVASGGQAKRTGV